MCHAIHINSRSWLRSSSTHELSEPPLTVVSVFQFFDRSRKRTTTTMAAPARNGFRETVSDRTQKRQTIVRGGRKPSGNTLNLRNASDVAVRKNARLHCQHAHLDKTSNRDRYPDTLTSIHGPVCTRVRLAGAGFHAENRPSSWKPPATSDTFSHTGNDTILHTVRDGRVHSRSVMILPQVHLRKRCYDFYFLWMIKFDRLFDHAAPRLPSAPWPIRGSH